MTVLPHILRNLFELIHQEDAFATLSTVWLADKCKLRMLLHILFKFLGLFRKQKADGCKVELLLKGLPHPIRNYAEHLLPCQVFNEWVSVPVELVLANSLKVFVAECKSKPVQAATDTSLFELVGIDYVLKGLQFTSAVACVYDKGVRSVFWFLVFVALQMLETHFLRLGLIF